MAQRGPQRCKPAILQRRNGLHPRIRAFIARRMMHMLQRDKVTCSCGGRVILCGEPGGSGTWHCCVFGVALYGERNGQRVGRPHMGEVPSCDRGSGAAAPKKQAVDRGGAALFPGDIDRVVVQQHLTFGQPAMPASRRLGARQRTARDSAQGRRNDVCSFRVR